MNDQLRDEERLTRGLKLLAEEMELLEAPAEIELKLREAFRNLSNVHPVAARSRYWLVAVAAALLIAISVVVMWRRSDAPQQKLAEKVPVQSVEVPVGPTEPSPKKAENQVTKRQVPKSIHRNTVARKSPETPVANHVTNEIATDFMPLGYMNAASLQDGGQIVRVKLRRSTLAAFGIPVNMDRYNEDVKADVLLGVDGLARAIRFVQ